MKYRETESLSLSVCSQISFKSKRVDSGNESFYGVQRGAWNWCILSDMTSERDEKHTVIIIVRLYEPHTLLWRRAYAQNVSFEISPVWRLFCLYQLQWKDVLRYI